MHVEQRREQAKQIWWAGVRAAQPASCIPAALEALRPLLQNQRPVLVIGGGKAGAAMGLATERWLLENGIPEARIHGWINVPEGSSPSNLNRVHLHPARPPGVNFPTPTAAAGTLRLLELIDQAPHDAVILCLISGGGSALLTAPVPGVPLEEKIRISQQLSAAGASIQQLNCVRKHLSQIKGGGLAQRCFARPTHRLLISLIISDVIGDPLDVIASGPTAPDPTTFRQAVSILDEFKLGDVTPPSVFRYLQAGAAGLVPETLKAPPRQEPQVLHRIIANNRCALDAASRAAHELGYRVLHLGDMLAGDTLDLAEHFIHHWPQWQAQRPLCVLSGGETTVRLPAHPGKGGRNQSLALALLSKLDAAQLDNVVVLCGGTDGEDGPTDAAGAIADIATLHRAQQLGLDPLTFLDRHDAYSYFDATGGLFRTGLTDTNVMDLRVFLFNGQVDP
jgi:hydroxypyruvate reductase/glycerate 2-kinase